MINKNTRVLASKKKIQGVLKTPYNKFKSNTLRTYEWVIPPNGEKMVFIPIFPTYARHRR